LYAGNKTTAKWQFSVRKTKSLSGNSDGTSSNFEQNMTRANDCHPMIDWTLSFSLTSFGWFFSDGLVRENANPNLSFTLEVTVYGNTS
jgi:hypothetical protein